MIGVVKGSEIRRNRDGARDVLVLRVQCGDVDDVQSVEMMCAMGDDFHPPVGTRVEITAIGSAYKIAVAGDDGIVPTTASGERKIYSIAGGVPSSWVHFRTNGSMELNGSADWVVAYTDMKQAFDQLKSDFDNHIHITTATVDAGPAGTVAKIATPSTADMTAAKVSTVKVP
jgi:hypothetical protein